MSLQESFNNAMRKSFRRGLWVGIPIGFFVFWIISAILDSIGVLDYLIDKLQ